MSSKSRISEGYMTVVPDEIRATYDVRVGDFLEWSIERGVIVVHPRHPNAMEGIVGRVTLGFNKVREFLSRAIARVH